MVCMFCGLKIHKDKDKSDTVYGNTYRHIDGEYATCYYANKHDERYKDGSGNYLLATPVTDQTRWSSRGRSKAHNLWDSDFPIPRAGVVTIESEIDLEMLSPNDRKKA